MTDTLSWAEMLAANIRAERARRGLRQSGLADRMTQLGYRGWYAQTVGKIEHVTRPVFAAELPGLCLALGCTMLDLLTPAGNTAAIELASGETLSAAEVRRLACGHADGAGAR